MRTFLVLMIAAAAAAAQAAPPEPGRYIEAVSAAEIDPENFDLAAAGLWSLPMEDRLKWNTSVVGLLVTGDYNNGCDAAHMRRFRALMWTFLSQNAPDADSWKRNAEALRARLKELDGKLEAAAAGAPRLDDPRMRELKRRIEVDQAARKISPDEKWRTALPPLAEQQWSGLMADRVWAVDCDNTAWLEAQLREVGWFDIDRFGQSADKDAWLLVQHADRSKAFQRQTLAMLQSLPPGKTDPRNLAYLHDRVATGEGRPQKYGTQGQCQPDGTWKPNPLEDPEGVDARRAAVGLKPIAEYALGFKDICKPPS